MNNDFRCMKFIYLYCGEETNLESITQLVERCTGIAEVMGSNLVRS